MNAPSEFGILLKKKRETANLTQNDLAETLNKSVQYISNIEKGKNNSPPKSSDIELLIKKLELNNADAILFRVKAAADRNQLPTEQMDYLLEHPKLIELIFYGKEHKINNKCWENVLTEISGGKYNDFK